MCQLEISNGCSSFLQSLSFEKKPLTKWTVSIFNHKLWPQSKASHHFIEKELSCYKLTALDFSLKMIQKPFIDCVNKFEANHGKLLAIQTFYLLHCLCKQCADTCGIEHLDHNTLPRTLIISCSLQEFGVLGQMMVTAGALQYLVEK